LFAAGVGNGRVDREERGSRRVGSKGDVLRSSWEDVGKVRGGDGKGIVRYEVWGEKRSKGRVGTEVRHVVGGGRSVDTSGWLPQKTRGRCRGGAVGEMGGGGADETGFGVKRGSDVGKIGKASAGPKFEKALSVEGCSEGDGCRRGSWGEVEFVGRGVVEKRGGSEIGGLK
jgi:hypothetical protein